MSRKGKIAIYIFIGIAITGGILYFILSGYTINFSPNRETESKATRAGRNQDTSAKTPIRNLLGNPTELKTVTPEVIYKNETIDVSGHIEPYQYENLSFKTAGEITYLPPREGIRVKKGTFIASIDDTEALYKLSQINYEIEQAKISGEMRKLELLKLQRKIYEKNLRDTKLYAGINGTIATIDKDLHELARVGETVVRIINTRKMKSTVEVDEIDAPKLKIGEKVLFHFDAFPDLKVEGRVSKIPVEGFITNEGIAVIKTELTIDSPPQEIVPYYSFNAEIIVKEREKIILLNKDAIMERNGKTLVLLKQNITNSENRKPPFKQVVIKEYDDTRVRIISGLKENEEVVLIPREVLQNASSKNKSVNPLSIFGIRTPGANRKTPRTGK